jgi:murein DD-endopeptidase MepM/ murein hydrolase activator NlpD
LLLRKRFYILFVARDAEGQLRKIPIPLHYMYVFLAGAMMGMFTITGMAGSYTRMLLKTLHFNELRSQKKALEKSYSKLEEVAREREIQVASLGSLASEVSALYGLKSDSKLGGTAEFREAQFISSLDQFYALRKTAMTGAATLGIGMGYRKATLSEWLRLSSAPTLWPVEGPVTGAFGERVDPFNGEGAFHRGVDISCSYGHAIFAPADGVVQYADFMSGYGRMVAIEHGQGINTRYGHLAGFAVTEGQSVHRGQIIGYVGLSGRSTGPHLHYEVWVRGTPVNPSRFLRSTVARANRLSGD